MLTALDADAYRPVPIGGVQRPEIFAIPNTTIYGVSGFGIWNEQGSIHTPSPTITHIVRGFNAETFSHNDLHLIK